MTRALIFFLSHPYCFAHRRTVPDDTSMRSRMILGERYRISFATINDHYSSFPVLATGCNTRQPIENTEVLPDHMITN